MPRRKPGQVWLSFSVPAEAALALAVAAARAGLPVAHYAARELCRVAGAAYAPPPAGRSPKSRVKGARF